MTRVEKTVFISYRRTNGFIALAIAKDLTHHGFDVFIDYQGIGSGNFEQVILENIRARAHFLILLTPSALECCDEVGDWFRREIEEALETKRNVVPLLLEGFDFSAPTIAPNLTGKLALVPRYNGMTVSVEYFDAAMTKLRDKFLNVSVEAVLHPSSDFAQRAAKDQQAAAAAAPPVTDRALTAEVWFERGIQASDLDEQIRCYTETLRLQPDLAGAYNNRGNACDKKGDHDGAIADFTEAIRLRPDYAKAFTNRGNARDKKGDHDGAIADFTEAIRLRPEYVKIFTNRGVARGNKGDLDGAIADFNEALRLRPNHAAAYSNRGAIHYVRGDYDGAIVDFTEAIRLRPDFVEAYTNRGLAFQAKGDSAAAQQDFDKAKRLRT